MEGVTTKSSQKWSRRSVRTKKTLMDDEQNKEWHNAWQWEKHEKKLALMRPGGACEITGTDAPYVRQHAASSVVISPGSQLAHAATPITFSGIVKLWKILGLAIIALLFVFDNYCLIMD
jgi:hypothetical protein